MASIPMLIAHPHTTAPAARLKVVFHWMKLRNISDWNYTQRQSYLQRNYYRLKPAARLKVVCHRIQLWNNSDRNYIQRQSYSLLNYIRLHQFCHHFIWVSEVVYYVMLMQYRSPTPTPPLHTDHSDFKILS